MVLRLKHTSSNYMLKLYAMNDDNVRIPYNLAGNSRYKLVFPTVTGDTIKLFPNADSENNNHKIKCVSLLSMFLGHIKYCLS